MRLGAIQHYLHDHGIAFQYWQEDDCGSITFIYHGLSYHIWEYPAPERGAQSNVRTSGKSEDYEGDYEQSIIAVMDTWW